MAELISHKRLSWVGHAIRRKPNDRYRIAVLKALEKTDSRWTKSVKEDFDKRGMDLREG